jgi:hypothetical protein
MTEEALDQSFGRYLATKTAVAAYGLSEFEEEPSFATPPSNSAFWAANVTIVSPYNVYAETVSQDYPHVLCVAAGSGKTHTFVR